MNLQRERTLYSALAAFLTMAAICAAPARAGLTAAQVLVVYNSRSIGAQTVLDAYLLAHPTIPSANVVDLNSTAIANVADVSYADFITYIRNPIRAWLDTTGHPTSSGIICLCLISGIPHRIKDTDSPTAGDDPNSQVAEFNNGDATSACVDSELVLLWQSLETGEAGGNMDSHSDNVIVNPYHTSTAAIDSFGRTKIKTAKTFSKNSIIWQLGGSGSTKLTPGDMYLVSRIDGTTTTDAVALITRAANLRVNRKYAWVVIDKDGVTALDDQDICTPPCVIFNAGVDYDNTRDHMLADDWNVNYDGTATFIYGSTFNRPVISYTSFGTNHNPQPSPTSFIEAFQFVPGAIFNTMESYNGRAFNGLGGWNLQEQIAHFISAGGTFAAGNVWEPFAFSVPDSDYLTGGLLVRGMTWAEAAWSSIPALSWQQIAIGDPLARVVQVIDQPADFNADTVVNDSDLQFLQGCATGPAMGPPTTDCAIADLDGDGDVDQSDFGLLQRCLSADPALLNPACAN